MVLDELAHVHEKVEVGVGQGMNAVDLQVDEIKTNVEGMRMRMMEVEEMQETMVADLQRKAHKIDHLEQLVAAQGEMIGVLCQGLDEQRVILLAMRHGRDHLIKIKDNSEEEEREDEDDGGLWSKCHLPSLAGWYRLKITRWRRWTWRLRRSWQLRLLL